ncbi:MAG: helix-turn-helix domain-containing protein [Deltaproteobacteria bacterium]|nr:helix-turn-helix domain-containing protein [Deltaproteobacteria bacterium]
MQEPISRPEFVGYDGAVQITGLAKPTLYSKVSRKEIPHYRLGRRLVRFRVDELTAWMSRGRVEAMPSRRS